MKIKIFETTIYYLLGTAVKVCHTTGTMRAESVREKSVEKNIWA